MNRAIDSRLRNLETATGAGRTQIIWTTGMGEAEIDAEIRHRRDAGELGEGDELLLIRWKTSADQGAEQ
jgi:hypothetical protein